MAAPTKRIRLKDLREDYNIPQGKLAEKAGVSHTYLSAIEKGKRGASEKLKRVLREEFHVDNLDDYEIEVERTLIKNYSFDNKGQLNQGQFLSENNNNKNVSNEKDNESSNTMEIFNKLLDNYQIQVTTLNEENKRLTEQIKLLLTENDNLKKQIMAMKT